MHPLHSHAMRKFSANSNYRSFRKGQDKRNAAYLIFIIIKNEYEMHDVFSASTFELQQPYCTNLYWRRGTARSQIFALFTCIYLVLFIKNVDKETGITKTHHESDKESLNIPRKMFLFTESCGQAAKGRGAGCGVRDFWRLQARANLLHRPVGLRSVARPPAAEETCERA